MDKIKAKMQSMREENDELMAKNDALRAQLKEAESRAAAVRHCERERGSVRERE